MQYGRVSLAVKLRKHARNEGSHAWRRLLTLPAPHSLLARNGCVCEGESRGVRLPFSQLLFPRVSAHPLHTAFKASELEEMKRRRAQEYLGFQRR